MAVEDLIKTVMLQLKEMVKTETVVGEPIQAGESTIVPVSRVSVGFGAGGGEGRPGQGKQSSGSGSGTGGGATIEPVAFIVITEDKAQLLSLVKKEAAMTKVIDLIPQVIEKVKDFKERRKEKEKAQQEKQ